MGGPRIDRRLAYWLTRRLYRRRTAAPSVPDETTVPADPQRVLLVRVDERVGNLITMQALIDALRLRWPSAQLGLLASTRAAQVTASLVGLDQLHALDKRWFFQHPGRWRRVIGEVRAHGYRWAIDASAFQAFSYTHAALTWYSGAPERVGFDRGPAFSGAGFHNHPVEPGPPGEYDLAQRLRLLAPLGVSGPPPALHTTLGQDRRDRFAAWLAEHRLARPRVGIWAGSRKLERRWPVPFYVQLGRRLQQRAGADLVVLWGPGEESLRDEFAQAIPSGLVVAPPTDLDELAGLMRNLDLVVTNDTGPMHLSVACQTPTLVLFPSGEPSRWGHPVAHARNLFCPGVDPAEVERAGSAALELLSGALTAPEHGR